MGRGIPAEAESVGAPCHRTSQIKGPHPQQWRGWTGGSGACPWRPHYNSSNPRWYGSGKHLEKR